MSKPWRALLAILILAAAIRVYRIGATGLWTDELASVETSAGLGLSHGQLPANVVIEPPPDLMGLGPVQRWVSLPKLLARDDNHPPLYYFLLRLWRTLFGDSEAALRSLSLVAGLAAIVFIFDAVQVAHGSAAAIWTALLMALAQQQVQFSQEARDYMLATGLGCAVLAAFVRIEQLGVNRRRVVALTMAVFGMMFTHYFSIGPLAALFIYAVIRLRAEARRAVVLSMLSAGVVLAAVWGWAMIQQRSHLASTTMWMTGSREGQLMRTIERVLELPVRYLNEPMTSSLAFAAMGAVIFLLPLLMIRSRPKLLLWWTWMCGAIGLVAAIDLWRAANELDFIRFTLMASPAVFAILATILANARSRLARHAIPAVAVLSCLISLPRAYEYYVPRRPDWNATAGALHRAGANQNDLLVLYCAKPDDAQYTRTFLLDFSYYLHPMTRAVAVVEQSPSPEVLERIRRAGGAIVVSFTDEGFPKLLQIEGWKIHSIPHDFALPMMWRMTPL